MQIVKNKGNLIALALALGCVALANPTRLFADEPGHEHTAHIFQLMANGAYIMCNGGGDYYSVGSLDLAMPLGSDSVYMRGQDAFDEGALDAAEAAQAQRDAVSDSDDKSSDGGNERVLWATPFYSSYSGHSNNGSMLLVNAEDFTMKRTGILAGMTKSYTARTSAGFLVGFSQGKMSQNFIFTNYSNSFNGAIDQNMLAMLNVNDFQFGGNFKHAFENEWTLDVNVLGGSQSYKWNRHMHYYGNQTPGWVIDEYYKGKTTGNTFSANIALSRKFDLDKQWSVTPCVGLESAHSWFFVGKETSGDTHFETINIAYRRYGLLENIQFSRNTARFGATVAYDADNYGFNGKAFYGTVLGGNDSTTAHVSDGGTTEFVGEGGGFGVDSLKLGGGFWATLDEKKTASIGGAYDATMYKRAISQTVSGTFTKSF